MHSGAVQDVGHSFCEAYSCCVFLPTLTLIMGIKQCCSSRSTVGGMVMVRLGCPLSELNQHHLSSSLPCSKGGRKISRNNSSRWSSFGRSLWEWWRIKSYSNCKESRRKGTTRSSILMKRIKILWMRAGGHRDMQAAFCQSIREAD